MNWVKTNWQILTFVSTFLVGGVTAWADTQNDIKNLKRDQEAMVGEAREQKIVREQVIRQDEQLKAIKESQKTQEQLLRDLIQGQRSIERKVSR